MNMPPALLLSAWSWLQWLCCEYDNAFNNMVFSLGLYFLQKQSGKLFFVFLFSENVELFSLRNKIAHFQTSCWVLEVMLSYSASPLLQEKKPQIRGKKWKQERKKRINAQVGYLAGRIHLERASNCCSLTRQCLKPGWWMNIFANILHDFTVEGLQQMQTQ